MTQSDLKHLLRYFFTNGKENLFFKGTGIIFNLKIITKYFLIVIFIAIGILNSKLNAQETTDLMTLYQEALKNDSLLSSARFQNEATKELIKQVKDQIVVEDDRNRYLDFLGKTLHDEYLNILEKEITKAFVSAYDEQAEALFNNYLDHAEAYVNMSTVKDSVTNEEIAPDESFMESIEQQIGITGTS